MRTWSNCATARHAKLFLCTAAFSASTWLALSALAQNGGPAVHQKAAPQPVATLDQYRVDGALSAPDVLTGFGGELLGERPPCGGQLSRTWTTSADFAEGQLINVNLGVPDQLRLNEAIEAPFPFYNVPARSRGTLIRINTRTGEVIGEYRTQPEGSNPGFYGPCRTAVDSEGAVWVCNRSLSSTWAGGSATYLKIGLVLGGTRGRVETDGTFVPDPTGEYLRPPFDYASSGVVDRDGDGLIRTSRGLGNLLRWQSVTDDSGSLPDLAGPALIEDAQDELMLVFQRFFPGHDAASVAVDGDDNLWVNSMQIGNGYRMAKLSKSDGSLLIDAGRPGSGGYVSIVDSRGVLWSGGGYTSNALRYDTIAGSGTGTVFGSFNGRVSSWAEAPNGDVWAMDISGTFWRLNRASGAAIASFASGGNNNRSIAFTNADGHLWTGRHDQGQLARYRQDGTFVAAVPVGAACTNAGVDIDGNPWTVSQATNLAYRIDPTDNTVDLTVNLGPGAGAYNYNDGTGSVTARTNQRGFWIAVQDGCVPGNRWSQLTWNADEPKGTSISFEVRASDSQINLPTQPWRLVQSGESLLGEIIGRYIQIRGTFERDPGSPPTLTPILFDATVAWAPLPCLAIDIYPNRTPNPIILSRDYTIYVQVINRAGEADAASFVDPTTIDWADPALVVRFGRAGVTAAAPVRPGLLLDLDLDGDLDALLGFRTSASAFQLGDVEGELTINRACQPLSGRDSIAVQP